MLLLWIINVISVLFLLCFRARLFIDALWSPAGKGLTSWLSFVMSVCEVVTFPLVSWVRCGALLYRVLIFAFFFTLNNGVNATPVPPIHTETVQGTKSKQYLPKVLPISPQEYHKQVENMLNHILYDKKNPHQCMVMIINTVIN